MKVTCPNCLAEDGVREAIYGLPECPFDKDRFFAAGCTASGPIHVCHRCGWGIESEQN